MSSVALAEPAARPDRDAETLARIRARLVRPMPTDRLLGWAIPLLITVVSGWLRLWHITVPSGKTLHHSNGLVFDEVYYAHDSFSLLRFGVETRHASSSSACPAHQTFCPEFIVHPPLGKWMIAAGEWLFDHGRSVTLHISGNPTVYPADALSFRISAAVIGTLSVLLIARIARRLFRSTLLGCVAGLLLSLDGLEFVQSRVSLLDIFLMFWVLASFGALVIDRDVTRRRLAKRLTSPVGYADLGPSLGWRPWRWVSGICIGAAAGVKWSGAYYIVAWLILVIIWDHQARKDCRVATRADVALRRGQRVGLGRWHWLMVTSDGFFSLLPLVVAPAVVYLLCWLGWFLAGPRYADFYNFAIPAGQHPGGLTYAWDVMKGWWHYQGQIEYFDSHLHAGHPYRSRPWGWLLMTRPILYYYNGKFSNNFASCGANTCSQEMIALGNPALWWFSIAALIACAWRWLGRRDWRGLAVLLPFVAGYLPWSYLDIEPIAGTNGAHRTMFFFYMVPEVPFMVLAVTLAVGLMLGHRARRPLSSRRRVGGMVSAAGYLGLVIALFAYFFPALSAEVISYNGYRARIWFDQCSNSNHTQENGPCWF